MQHRVSRQLQVARIGPAVATPERSERAYYAWAPGEGMVEFAATDEDGLAQLAARGRSLRCEPELADAARGLGLPIGVPAKGAYHNAASLSLLALMRDVAPDVAGRKALVDAAGVFLERRPWEAWGGAWRPDRALGLHVDGAGEVYRHAVLVTGADDADDAETRGFYLFADLEHVTRFSELFDAKDVGAISLLPALHILFRREPEWAARLFGSASGTRGLVPTALRNGPKGSSKCSFLDCTILAATTFALAKVTPKNTKAEVTLETPVGRVRARASFSAG